MQKGWKQNNFNVYPGTAAILTKHFPLNYMIDVGYCISHIDGASTIMEAAVGTNIIITIIAYRGSEYDYGGSDYGLGLPALPRRPCW